MFRLNLNDNRNFARYVSVERMKEEQIIHKRHYRMRIHPYSRFRVCWETFFCGFSVLHITCTYVFFFLSRYAAFSVGDIISIAVPDLVIAVNIYLNFITGYFEEGRERAQMRLSKIAKKYVTTLFFPDIIGLLLGSPLISLITYDQHIDDPSRLESFYLFVLRCAGIFMRVTSPWLYWTKSVSLYFLCDGMLSKVVQQFSFFPLVLLMLTAICVCAAYEQEPNFMIGETPFEAVNRYFGLASEIWGSGEPIFTEDQPFLILLSMITVVFPYCRYFITSTFLILIFWSSRSSKDRYNEECDNLNEYLQRVRISDRLKIRLTKFYEETMLREGNFFSEEDLLDHASCELKEEIVSLKIARIRQEITVLSYIPFEELIEISRHLVYELYFGNDVIAYSGEPHDRIYFVARGTVAVYSDDAKELYHITASQHMLIAGINPNLPALDFNYLSCETSVLYSLSRSSYTYIIEKCPIFKELLNFVGENVIALVYFLREKHEEEEDQ